MSRSTLPALHVGDEIFDRFGLIDRIGVDGIGVENSLADIAERLIHGVSQRMDGWRLMIARDDEARTVDERLRSDANAVDEQPALLLRADASVDRF